MSSEPVALHDRAADNLRYIRQAMERAGLFTAVPGYGSMGMGVSAVGAAWLANRARDSGTEQWLRVWLFEVVVAIAIGLAALIWKSRRFQMPLFSGVGRKFVLSLTPALIVGGLLTLALVRWGVAEALPGVWMLLYGAGVATGGAYSVKVVPITGVFFMAAGAATIFMPVSWADAMMAASFGGLHIVFGWNIARKHGG